MDQQTKIADRGFWVGASVGQHFYDVGVCNGAIDIFRGSTVVDLGCGDGKYVAAFKAAGIECDGYDGNPHTPLFNPSCKVLDLSVPVTLAEYDFVFSLEVGEHLPPQYEDVFLNNLHRHNRKGMVLSWAIPGQGGFGHFNERSNEYIRRKISSFGYTSDPVAESSLRGVATLPWFKNTIMVFRRVVYTGVL